MLNNPFPYIDGLSPEIQIRELKLCIQACNSSMERSSNLPGKLEMMKNTRAAAQEQIDEIRAEMNEKPFRQQAH